MSLWRIHCSRLHWGVCLFVLIYVRYVSLFWLTCHNYDVNKLIHYIYHSSRENNIKWAKTSLTNWIIMAFMHPDIVHNVCLFFRGWLYKIPSYCKSRTHGLQTSFTGCCLYTDIQSAFIHSPFTIRKQQTFSLRERNTQIIISNHFGILILFTMRDHTFQRQAT